MSVIPLTIFFSLLLAGLFALLFAREQSLRRFPGAERDSLLPLADEQARLAGTDKVERDLRARSKRVRRPRSTHEHDHDHSGDSCGCHDGSRPPCPGCLKRAIPPGLRSS